MDIETLQTANAAQSEEILTLRQALLMRGEKVNLQDARIRELEKTLLEIGSGQLIAELRRTQEALRISQKQIGGLHMEVARLEVGESQPAKAQGAALLPAPGEVAASSKAEIIANQVAIWRQEIARLNDLIATAVPSEASEAERKAAVEVLTDKQMREAVAEGLRGLYGCGRVWSACGVGTMSEDDFYPAEESDECITQVVDAIESALASQSGAADTADKEQPGGGV